MSKTQFTPAEAAQIALEFTRRRVETIAKNLKDLRERELKKAIVPPHKHTTGTSTSQGVEDVPPAKINPPGKNDVLKGAPMEDTPGEETSGERSPADVLDEAMKKEELCKKCGKGHDMAKGCDGMMDKAMLKDSKGKEKDNGVVAGSVLPDDKKSKEVSADGSGGDIVKKSETHAFVSNHIVGSTKGSCHECGETVGHKNHHMSSQESAQWEKDRSTGPQIKKAATPPMAKPPSGKNMGTHVPTSVAKEAKPEETTVAKEVKELVVHGDKKPVKPPKGADYSVKEGDKKTSYIRKNERPGIFGRLDKSETLAKGRSSILRAGAPTLMGRPALKGPGQGLHAAGGSDELTGSKTDVPLGGSDPGIPPTKTNMSPTAPTQVGAKAALGGMMAGAQNLGTAMAKPNLPRQTMSQLPKSPILTNRPALKAPGQALVAADPTAASGAEEGGKTQLHTMPGKPSNVNPTKPSASPMLSGPANILQRK